MKQLVLTFLLFIATQASAETSYVIIPHGGTFCDDKRTLLKVIDGRIHVFCAETPTAVMAVTNGDKALIGGITFAGDALEWIANH